jgi:hypothetical protein
MSLDWKKIKRLLEKNHITPIEFFCMDPNECALIKCFLNKNAEFLFIYVSSKHRFTIKKENNEKIYLVEDIEDTTENDDYSKSEKIPDMDAIDEEKNDNLHKELTRKYQKNISLEGNDEPIQRKIKRQIDRLKIPFSRLSYDIALQSGKWLALSFGGDISLFSIKAYDNPDTKVKTFFYLMNLSDLIEKIEDFQDEIDIIREQFYEIVNRVSISNMENISSEVDQYALVIKSITNKKTDYFGSIQDYQSIYNGIIERENELSRVFKDRLEKETGVKRSSTELEYQRQYETIFKSKKESVKRGIELVSRFQRNLLILEEVSFDNTIMIKRVKNNFKLLKETL